MKRFILMVLLPSLCLSADVEVSAVDRVVDGDTVDLKYVQRFFPDPDTRVTVERFVRVRFAGVDTWERGSDKGKKATDALVELIQAHQIRLVTSWKKDGFGRLLGKLIYYDRTIGRWRSVNKFLWDGGHVDPSSEWSDKAEQEEINVNRGNPGIRHTPEIE